MMHKRIIAALAMTWLLAACAPANQVDYDPLESVNREIFAFNQVLDGYIFEPLARGYRYIVPEIGRAAVGNVLRTLVEPVNFVNATLQADPAGALTAFSRFVVNASLGVGGLYDFAGNHFDIQYQPEDFGQTLAVWGVESGAYIVIPILGPSNLRDGFGRIADTFTDPLNVVGIFGSSDTIDTLSIIRSGVSALAAREKLLDPIDVINETSLDPYATFRSAYGQQREALVENRNTDNLF